jgi:hypothetical protein
VTDQATESTNDIAARRATGPQCGGAPDGGETCADRFAQLLALDHSRQQPWSSQHGVAFSVYMLQHRGGHLHAAVYHSCSFVQRVYTNGEEPTEVARQIREANGNTPAHGDDAPLRGADDPPRRYAVTLGAFEADAYADALHAWCHTTIAAWTASA